jgi:hypothetical protein
MKTNLLTSVKKTFTLLLLMGATTLMAQTPHALVKVTEDTVDYWVIDTEADLIWLASTTDLDADGGGNDFADLDVKWAANYRLGADITFPASPAGYDWNNDGLVNATDALGLPTISAVYHEIKVDVHPFTGHFNGQFYTILNAYKNVTADEVEEGAVGLFGNVFGATIENLRLLDFDFHSKFRQCAGIVSISRDSTNVDAPTKSILRRLKVVGSLEYTAGSIINSAGIVGKIEYGEITECVAEVISLVDVAQEPKRQGAIVGSQLLEATIKNCYSVSTMTGYQQAGQIVGLQKDGATIENCYAAGLVTGSKKVGSFAGQIENSSVSSYWDTDIQADGVGDGGGDEVGLATAAFATESNFVGWDFGTIWKIGDVNGVQRPYLQWEDLAPGTVLSVDEISLEGSLLRAYPNPASSRLTIENAPLDADFSLTNLLGQEQTSGTIEGTSIQLNVESYNKGIYILRVGTTASKIIIE